MENWKQCVERVLIGGGLMVLVFLAANLWYLKVSGENSCLPSAGQNSLLKPDTGETPLTEPLRGESEAYEDVKPKIALTFDDGPHPVYTVKLLDGLKERGVKATFFVVGKNIVGREAIIKRMAEEGHLIGNHTYDHVNMNLITPEKACGELSRTNDLVKQITGQETDYVRPPFGLWDKQEKCALNMMPVLWNIDPRDWDTPDAALVTKRVVTKAKENAIILMHDYYDTSVTAALQIVDQLQEKGYRFVTVEEILLE